MKRPIVFFPVNVAYDDRAAALAEFVSEWDQRHSDHPLIIAAKPQGAQVYLVVGSSADLADEVFAARRIGPKKKRWPDLPVIWADGGPTFYRSIDDFTNQAGITLDDLLRQVFGTLTRQGLIVRLEHVLHTLDDASAVVDVGDDEDYAYQPELTDLRHLIEKLEHGAFLVDEPSSIRRPRQADGAEPTWRQDGAEGDRGAIRCPQCSHDGALHDFGFGNVSSLPG